MNKINDIKQEQSVNGYCLGLFGLSWRICDSKEVKSFGYLSSPAVPSALSGSFASLEEAKTECIERNKRIFI